MDFMLNTGAFSTEQNFNPLDPDKLYDVIILGGGPAGLTAGVYCIRKGLTTGLAAKKIGGQVAETSGIENYMGYRYISGNDLVNKFREQVLKFGIDFEEDIAAVSVNNDKIKRVKFEDGRSFSARALIIATGKSSRKLDVPGEREFTGRGVAYCSTCDAPFFSGKNVVVVGGGNSALEAAIDLVKVSEHVTIVQFLEKLTADRILVDKLDEYENYKIIYRHEIVEIKGESEVQSVAVKSLSNSEVSDIKAEGIFVEIGLIPNSEFMRGVVDLNPLDEIFVDCGCNTDKTGIFAAGDVTSVMFNPIIVAAGEGAKAALSASENLLKV